MKIIVLKDNYTCESFPEIYIIPDSGILKDSKPFFIPAFADKFLFNTHLIVRIDRLGKNISKKFAPRYYSQLSVGLTVTADMVGVDGAMANSFDSAAIMGDFISKEELENHIIETYIDNTLAHSLDTNTLCNDIDSIIEHISKYFTLKIGDIIYTGYNPNNQTELKIQQTITATLNNQQILHARVR